MEEIFKFYFDLTDTFDLKYTWISHNYQFPDLSGLNADYVIKKWIMSYMAILFLRQYTIIPHLITMKPLNFPTIPKTQGEIMQWINGMDFFKELVDEHLQNKELLKTLNLDFIADDWCEKNQKPCPVEFLDKFKLALKESYEENAVQMQISSDKVHQFEETTETIITSAFEKIMLVNNNDIINDDNTDTWYVNGQRMVQSKDAFSDNPEAHHLNYDSFLASVIENNIYEGLAQTFYFKRTKSYLLKPEDIFKGIDKLGIDDNFVIVNFGLNLDFFINHLKVAELSNDKYKNVNVYSFNGSRLVRDALFVLKKSDLPNISTLPIDNEVIKKYSLSKISDKINLYSSVIDLNETSDEIINESKNDKSEAELRKSVLLSIYIIAEIKWKKNIKVIQLNQHSDYLQRGIAHKLSDVKAFDDGDK